ncbi:MAG: DUF5685 family protein [Faecalibacterium sp.]|jgi:hypothetical protein|nr:DUF5685 family protein [Faecalibacterium sp.]
MFGYVLTNPKALSPEAAERYRASYCGLCRRLGARYGLLGRLTLSYDLTFLDLLLSSLYEEPSAGCTGCRRCPAHPLKAQGYRYCAGPADYCADLSIALHYYSAEDKWHDDRSLPARLLMALLKKRLPGIEQRWSRPCRAIQAELAELRRLEAENCQDPDVTAACFGRLMAALFDWKQDRWAPELRAMGMALGEYIYLLDAADDLEKDRKRGAYNPLYRFSEAKGWQTTLRQGLESILARCTAAFHILPCVEDVDILQNILLSGLWARWPFPEEGENPEKEEKKPAQD